MAYAQSTPVVTVTTRSDGLAEYHVAFTETEGAAASEWSVKGLPRKGTITLLRVAPTFTTAATVQPAFGRAASWTAASISHIGQVAIAAATINDKTTLRYDGLTGLLYGRTTPNAGADTVTAVEFSVVEGHI